MAHKVGLIGAGRWGRNFIKTLAQQNELTLSAVYSSQPETRSLIPSDCKLLSDWRELIKLPGLSGIIIASPPQSHFEILKSCIVNRIPALIEKPLTLELTQAHDLQNLNQEYKTPVLVDHIHIFNEAYLAIKNQFQIESDQTLEINSEGMSWGPFRDYSSLWDYGPHDLSLIFDWMSKNPDSINAKTIKTEVISPQETGKVFELKLQFGSVLATVKIGNLSQEKTRKFVVRGLKNTYVYDDRAIQKAVCFSNQHPDKIKYLSYPGISPLESVLSVFSKIISGNLDARMGLELAINVVKYLDAAQIKIGL